MKEFKLNKTDVDGILIEVKDGFDVMVDRYGFQLFYKYLNAGTYRWRIYPPGIWRAVEVESNHTSSVKKYITFERELLGLPGTIPIYFKNEDPLDLRICNLLVCRGKYPTIHWINKKAGNDYGVKFDIPSWYNVYC